MTSASWTVCGDMVADFPRAVGDSTAGRTRLDRTEFAERRRSFLDEPRAPYVLKYRWFSGVRDFFAPIRARKTANSPRRCRLHPKAGRTPPSAANGRAKTSTEGVATSRQDGCPRILRHVIKMNHR